MISCQWRSFSELTLEQLYAFLGNGYGRQLIRELLRYCEEHFPGVPISCLAQYYLQALV